MESARFWDMGLGCDQRTRLRCGVLLLLGCRLNSFDARLDSVAVLSASDSLAIEDWWDGTAVDGRGSCSLLVPEALSSAATRS